MDRKPCVHCGRSIDAAARLCLYCNKDQSAPVEPTRLSSVPTPAAVVKKAPSRGIGTRLLIVAAVAVLLIATFAVGSLVYGLGKKDKIVQRGPIIHNQPAPIAEAAPPPPLTAEPAPPLTVPDSTNNGSQIGADATGMPADQYSHAVSATATTQTGGTRPGFQGVDPRTITNSVPAGAPVRSEQGPTPPQKGSTPPSHPRKPEPSQPRLAQRSAHHHTPPRPIEQPLPDFGDFHRGGTVRMNLTIGTNGKVKEIEILKGVSGITPNVVDAAQHWKFEPATEDGHPVEDTFLVDISFNEND